MSLSVSCRCVAVVVVRIRNFLGDPGESWGFIDLAILGFREMIENFWTNYCNRAVFWPRKLLLIVLRSYGLDDSIVRPTLWSAPEWKSQTCASGSFRILFLSIQRLAKRLWFKGIWTFEHFPGTPGNFVFFLRNNFNGNASDLDWHFSKVMNFLNFQFY